MTRTILVPVDDSPQARAAVAHAVEIHPDADITLLHVIEYSETITNLHRGGRHLKEGWYAEAREEATELLEAVLEDATDYEGEFTTAIVDGKPPEAIKEYVDEHDVDQVVMGSHGRTGATRVLIGSVAEKVARRADVPVTIVP